MGHHSVYVCVSVLVSSEHLWAYLGMYDLAVKSRSDYKIPAKRR